MGIYLPKPNTEKLTTTGKSGNIEFVESSMQGWRMSMEDAHICRLNIVEGVHLFAVFDGHGGSEVAKFCSKHFVDSILENENFKKKNYSEALDDTFHEMDRMMRKDDFKLLKTFL